MDSKAIEKNTTTEYRDEIEEDEDKPPIVISAELIETEGPLKELEVGTFFFTLYASDFIDANLNNLARKKGKKEFIYRAVNERFHSLSVRTIYKFV